MRSTLADIVLVAHFLWIAAVLVPIPLIVIGARRGARRQWNWTRSFAIRIAHLSMIAIVVVESLVGMICPLTVWEDALRRRGGQGPGHRSFVADWIGRVLFYDFPPWVFTSVYIAVGLLVLFLFWRFPPRRQPQ